MELNNLRKIQQRLTPRQILLGQTGGECGTHIKD